MKPENIHTIGIWAFRSILAAGVIGCSIVGRDEAATGLIVLIFLSFLFLD